MYRLAQQVPSTLGVRGSLNQRVLWSVSLAMIAWGAINSAIPVCWSTRLSKGISDEPESGGGLMVGAIQLSIMAGGALGGVLLDRLSVTATLVGGCVLLVLAAVVVQNGRQLQPTPDHSPGVPA